MIPSQAQPRIEVHAYPAAVVWGVTFLSLVLHGFLPRFFGWAGYLELPLLVTVYFGLSRRNPVTGLLLGMVIGLAQDSISGPRVKLGQYGLAKTLVGFLASSIGAQIDVEHPVSRSLLTFSFFYLHYATLVLISRVLLGDVLPLFTTRTIVAAGVNTALALLLFPLLDRLRKRE
jgi:rod shape-determining protein MreD